MKRFMIFAAAALSLLVACNKAVDSGVTVETNYDGDEIVIGVGSTFDAILDTRATAITPSSNLPSTLYWGGTGSAAGNWNTTSSSVTWTGSGSKTTSIATGKYVNSSSPATVTYYVTNLGASSGTQPMSIGSPTILTVANNNTDVLCGKVSSSSASPSLALEHIFCRTGSFSVSPISGYYLENVVWQIKGKSTSGIQGTAGTYNMTTGDWATATTKMNSLTTVTNSSDLYLIPGDYTLSLSFNLCKGEGNAKVSKSYSKTADVTFPKGKICNISAGSQGDDFAAGITITVSVQDWVEQNFTPEFS